MVSLAMRRMILASATVAAVGLVGYAAWLLHSFESPDAPASPALVSEATPAAVPADRRSPMHSPPAHEPERDDAEFANSPTVQPDVGTQRPELGDSLDPAALEQARAVYEQAMHDLERLDHPTPEQLASVVLRARSALERIEDELAPDDTEGWARYREDVARMRVLAATVASDTGSVTAGE